MVAALESVTAALAASSLGDSGVQQLVVLEVVQEAWGYATGDANRANAVRQFFKGPEVFQLLPVQEALYMGTRISDGKKLLLVEASVVPFLSGHLLLYHMANVPQAESTGRADADNAAASSAASPSGSGALKLPGLDALPKWAVADGQFDDVAKVDVSDSDKLLAVIKSIMKHNRDTKKALQYESRSQEAKKQLRIAGEMVARHSSDVARGGTDAGRNGSGGGGERADSAAPHSVFVCVDLEWWEQDPSKLLEIGWSTWDSVSGAVTSKHWICEENLATNNGRYVPNHKHDFRFGTSIVGPSKAGARALQADMDPGTWVARWQAEGATASTQPQPRIALLGHGMSGDLKLLDVMGVLIPPGTELIDTNCLAWGLLGGKQVQVSLRNMLGWLEVEGVTKLHNAGNDAHFTLQAALRMAKLAAAAAVARR
ncbi:hypothetical protein FOA52_015448 [Chlamydomonas sp. UWO 241]|nr:hypothetical protein FOA52_015448 [Chlamydomonas sp. UWO 241]